MKALVIHEPWAAYIDHGHKRIETRSWSTRYRGPLLICAGKTWNYELSQIAQDLALTLGVDLPYPSDVQRASGFRGATWGPSGTGAWAPLGAALCIAQLDGCVPVEKLKDLTLKERTLGNYDAGRYGWILNDVRRLSRPCQVTGAQGLFEVPDERIAVMMRVA